MFEYARAYVEPGDMSPQDERVWSLIREHKGADNAISVAHICDLCNMNDRKVRMIVKALIEAHGKPIGSTTSSPAGYYVINDDAERKSVQASLYRRAVSILRRARAYESNPIRKGWVSEVVGQLDLFESESNLSRSLPSPSRGEG
jgi:hypothetical protein